MERPAGAQGAGLGRLWDLAAGSRLARKLPHCVALRPQAAGVCQAPGQRAQCHIGRRGRGVRAHPTIMSEAPMNARLLPDEADELLRLPPVVDTDALPPGFEDILEVQVLAYRQKLALVGGERRRVLDPVWTLVPRDR